MTALSQTADDYLRLRRSLGHKLADAGRLLPRLVAYLESNDLETITIEAAMAWAQQPNADPTSTQNILNALNNVLSAENTLIQSWVSYEIDRVRLLLDTEALQVDEQGRYYDEHDIRAGKPGISASLPPAQAASSGN